MKFSTADIISLSALCLSLITNIIGGYLWIRSADKKKFAAEREFLHVKNGLIDLSANLNLLFQDLDHDLESIKRDIFTILVYLKLNTVNTIEDKED